MSRPVGSKLLGALSWGLISLAAISGVIVFLVILDGLPENRDAALGFLMFAAFFGVPGGILRWRLTRQAAEDAFWQQFVGFVRVRDRFTLDEMAQSIGKTPMETQTLLMRLAGADEIELAYHRPTAEYFHRNRLTAGARTVSKCDDCGGTFTPEIVLEGEVVSCQYCGSPL